MHYTYILFNGGNVKKKVGKSFTMYLPESLVAKAKVIADDRDQSVSFIVACALRQYVSDPQKVNAPLAATSRASV